MDLLQSHEKENFGLKANLNTLYFPDFVIYDVQVKDVKFCFSVSNLLFSVWPITCIALLVKI